MGINDVKISTKLMFGFAMVTVLLLIVGIVGFVYINSLDNHIEEIGMVRLPSIESLQDIKLGGESVTVAVRTLLNLDLEDDVRQQQYDDVVTAREHWQAAWNVYEPLPQTAEEARLWNQFVPLWNNWRQEHDVFFGLMNEFEALDLGNPYQLDSYLEQFRGDHYAVVVEVTEMLDSGVVFDGGDSYTACNFGRWLAEFESSNREVSNLLNAMAQPHRDFHLAVADIKNLVQAGNMEQARNVYRQEMVPAMEEVFDYFYQLLEISDNAINIFSMAEAHALGPIRDAQIAANDLLDEIIHLNEEIAEEAVEIGHREGQLAGVIIVVVVIISLIAAVVLALGITRMITKPINTIRNEAKELAKTGDLSKRATIYGMDEIGHMAHALNEMLDNVAGPVKKLSEDAERIANGDLTQDVNIEAKGDIKNLVGDFKSMVDNLKKLITEIKSNASESASSAEELSASAEEVNASMEQVSSTIEEVAKGAQTTSKGATDAQEQSKQTSESAEKGNKSAQEVNEKMAEISTSTKDAGAKVKELGEKSAEITRIVDTINEISEQTNLLALNAAIEAARAGDAGKGFAVVADEVRKLAEQSQNATTQIKDMIDDIQTNIKNSVEKMEENTRHVDEGSQAVQEAMKAFESIPELVSSVDKALADMSAVAQENAAGSEEVSSSVQQVTSSMQQVSSSAQQLSAGAESLRQLVSKFKVDDVTETESVKQPVKTDIEKQNDKKKTKALYEKEKSNLKKEDNSSPSNSKDQSEGDED